MSLRSTAFRSVILCCIAAVGATSANAETWYWTGLAGDNSWNNGGNWSSLGNSPGIPLFNTDFVNIVSGTVNLDFNFQFEFATALGSLNVTDSTFTINSGWQLIAAGDVSSSGTSAGSDLISTSGSMIVGGNFNNQNFGTLTMIGGSLFLNNVGNFVNSGSATLNIFDSSSGAAGWVGFGNGTFYNQGHAILNIVGGGLNPSREINDNFSNSDEARVFVQTDTNTGVNGLINAVAFTNSGSGYVEVDAGSSIYAFSNIQNLDQSALKIVGGSVSTGATDSAGTFFNSANASVIVEGDPMTNQTGTLSALSFTNQGTMEVDRGGYIYSTGTFTNAAGGTLNAISDLSVAVGTFSNQGNLNLSGGLIQPTGDFVNSGSGTVTAQDLQTNYGYAKSAIYGASLTNKESATIAVNEVPGATQSTLFTVLSGPITNQDNASITLNGSQMINYSSSGSGALLNRDSAQISVLQNETDGFQSSLQLQGFSFINQNQATLSVLGSTMTTGTLTNQGSAKVFVSTDAVTQSGSTVTVSGQVQNLDSGYVKIDGGSSLVSAGYFQTGVGAQTKNLGTLNSNVTLGNPGDAAGSAGTFGGGGTVTANLTNNAGTVAPGDPALLTVTGDFVQGSNGALVLDVLSANGPGVGNDKLIVSGVATLGGTLDIVFGNGFMPGDTFEILSANSIVGSFSTIEESFQGEPGDYILPPGSFHFSNGIGMITTSPVPEPSTLLALGLFALPLLRRQSRKA